MWTGTGLDAASFGVTSELLGYETALAFARKLPVAIRVSGTGIDFCGRMSFALLFEESQVGRGWVDGDVNYNPGGGWFAHLFDDEENSMRYADHRTADEMVGLLGNGDVSIAIAV